MHGLLYLLERNRIIWIKNIPTLPVNLHAHEISHPMGECRDLQSASEQCRQRLSSPQKLCMSHRVSPQIFIQDLNNNVSAMHTCTSDVLLWISPETFIPKTRAAFKIRK